MDFPKPVLTIVGKAAAKYGDDVEQAVAYAGKLVRRLKEYDVFAIGLVDHALRELIYDARHQTNLRIRRENGNDVDRVDPKVVVGRSPAVAEVYESVYSYLIAGMMLGSVRGDVLEGIASSERAKANGHGFNANLAEALHPMVPADKTVREVVSEKKLQALFRRLQE